MCICMRVRPRSFVKRLRDYVQARGTRVRESARSPACQDSVARDKSCSVGSVAGATGGDDGGGDDGDDFGVVAADDGDGRWWRRQTD